MLRAGMTGELDGQDARRSRRCTVAFRQRAALAVALLVSASLPATALALGNHVAEKVSKRSVKIGATFTLTASGEAAEHDVLWQFLDYRTCAATEKAEAARHNVSDHESVFGVFRVGPLTANSAKAGGDHACAYLVHHNRTVARSAAKFTVVR
jgi:hypothetical protein